MWLCPAAAGCLNLRGTTVNFKIRAPCCCNCCCCCVRWQQLHARTHTHTHCQEGERTQRPNATASRSWICLLQISRDIFAITVTERWEDDFGWALVRRKEEGCLRAQGSCWHEHRTHTHAPLQCTEQLPIRIKILFGLSWRHEPLIICNRVSLLTWIIQLTPIFLSTCGVWSTDWVVCCQQLDSLPLWYRLWFLDYDHLFLMS